MPAPNQRLAFERPIYELEERIASVERAAGGDAAAQEELRRLRRERLTLIRKIFSQLEPWETVQVARHPERPMTTDYLGLVFDEFVELHGDKTFGDDRALRTGFAKLDERKVLVVGHEKGRTLKERTACYFGCAHPEGYRKALAKMRLAAKFGMPVICLIDTPGAYPGIGAEERGQAQIIATAMYEMSRLPTPIICVVIGEGGSGGALGIGVGDKVAILEHAYYSVISPEGCAGILWKSHTFAEQAAKALKITSRHLRELKVVDDVIEEPLGGAHRDPHQMAGRLKQYLARSLRELVGRPTDQLLAARYEKFRRMGVFLEGDAENGAEVIEPRPLVAGVAVSTEDSNPYRSPTAMTDLAPSRSAWRLLLRWRTIPVTCLAIFGLYAGLLGLAGGLNSLSWRILHRGFGRSSFSDPMLFAFALWLLSMGSISICAAWYLWRGKWRSAAIWTMIGVAVYLGVGFALNAYIARF